VVGVNDAGQAVTSTNEALRKRVEAVLDMAVTTVSSLTESFFSGAPVQSPDYLLKAKEVGITEASSEGSAMNVVSKPEAQGDGDAGGGQAIKGDAEEVGESEESDFELEVHT